MNAKHTPGPWSIEPEWSERCGGSVAVVNRDHPRDDWDVCEVHSTEANARLIAAAPDLLDALELVAAWGPPCCLSADEAKTFAADQEKARAAIAKARGEA